MKTEKVIITKLFLECALETLKESGNNSMVAELIVSEGVQ